MLNPAKQFWPISNKMQHKTASKEAQPNLSMIKILIPNTARDEDNPLKIKSPLY